VGLSKETIESELQHTAKLNNKHRGELAELFFMRKAAALGFAVAKPWGESEPYDVIVRSGKLLWRVQIKSVKSPCSQKRYYQIASVNSRRLPYSPEDIDFLVAYIFPEDTWYIFPTSVVKNRTAIYVTPTSKKSRYEQYLEAWDLMRASSTPLTESGPAIASERAAPAGPSTCGPSV
jgi:PD-(D/E)XK endonuclease